MKKKAELRAVMMRDGPDGLAVQTGVTAEPEDLLILLSVLVDDAAAELGLTPAQTLEAIGEAHGIVTAHRAWNVDVNALAQQMGQRE